MKIVGDMTFVIEFNSKEHSRAFEVHEPAIPSMIGKLKDDNACKTQTKLIHGAWTRAGIDSSLPNIENQRFFYSNRV